MKWLVLAGALSAWIGLPPAYILPGERVVEVLSEKRQRQTALRIEAELSGYGEGWPAEVRFELHPVLGNRVSDEHGHRWLIRDGRIVAGPDGLAPRWIPELEILSLQSPEGLLAWIERAGIDLEVNQLARCGEQDCFVLGGTTGRAQLWLEKERFEVMRWVSARGSTIDFDRYASWDGQRFPAIVELGDRNGPFATLVVHQVEGAPELGPRDYDVQWATATAP